jgi:hypothetical protein
MDVNENQNFFFHRYSNIEVNKIWIVTDDRRSQKYTFKEREFFENRILNELWGHNHLLEIRLLKKSAPHDFIIARHHSSNNYFFCQLLENQKS